LGNYLGWLQQSVNGAPRNAEMLGDGGRTHRAGQALDLGGVDAGWRPLYFALLLALANENVRLCVPTIASWRPLPLPPKKPRAY
jgi:hypothetical protein